MTMLSQDQVRDFREVVWDYYHAHARQMPWRDDPSPYHVLVSELMLQQTQVARVVPKYQQFIRQFPTIDSLASAPLSDVLAAWSGLGYNRRAKYLYQAAQMVVAQHSGQLPAALQQLVQLPGVGPNTAGAVLAYAYNQPVVFIETNVRTVFFYHFFTDQQDVDDKQLLPLVKQTCDPDNPREWYWALMDYGTYLKQTHGNNIAQSKHHVRQSKFQGSRRQIRGAIMRALIGTSMDQQRLIGLVPDQRVPSVLDDLVAEGFVQRRDGQLRLTGSVELP